jgi:hypothetical protein
MKTSFTLNFNVKDIKTKKSPQKPGKFASKLHIFCMRLN